MEHMHRYAIMGVEYDETAVDDLLLLGTLTRLFAPSAVGNTTISLRCEDCGEPATRIVRGHWQDGALRP